MAVGGKDYSSQFQQHLGDDSWLGHMGEVAVACENVDIRAWDCYGGPGT